MAPPLRLLRLLDRAIARFEVSRLAVVPFAATVLLFWPMMVVVKVAAVTTDIGLAPLARTMLAVWVALLGLELARRIWTARHRYASPRWLRGVRAAVGEEVVVHAIADLMRQHWHDPNHVVTREDMIRAVQVERSRRRDAAQRAEGFWLCEEPPPAQPEPRPAPQRPRISDEQRARARERRAARRARETS